MKKTITMTLALASLCTLSQGAITQWQTASQAIASNVTSSTNGGLGYTLTGFGGISYDYGVIDGIGGAAVNGSTVEFVFNLTDSGSSTIIGSFLSWSPGNEWQYLKLEQWNNTGKFGLTTPGAWDKLLSADSLFDQDVHVALRRNNDSGTLDFFLNGVYIETESTKTNWRQDGGVGYIGSANNGTGDAAVGTVYGVASYDAPLTDQEIAGLYSAFTSVPEPSSAALLGLGGFALILRRSK